MKQRVRRSIIWKTEKIALQEIVKNSQSLADVLRYFKISTDGGNCKSLKKRMTEDGIDFSHIPTGLDSRKGKKFVSSSKTPLSEMMTKSSSFTRGNLKRRLIVEGILKEACAKCGLAPMWNGEKLVLVLDHINGIKNDNRKENLKFLCPNCNSQTETFSGRNVIRLEKPKKLCLDCKKEIDNKNKEVERCFLCASKFRRTTKRPSIEVLKRKISENGYKATGREYGVSDVTIRKWIIPVG